MYIGTPVAVTHVGQTGASDIGTVDEARVTPWSLESERMTSSSVL
jgi:hypothetical protein